MELYDLTYHSLKVYNVQKLLRHPRFEISPAARSSLDRWQLDSWQDDHHLHTIVCLRVVAPTYFVEVWAAGVLRIFRGVMLIVDLRSRGKSTKTWGVVFWLIKSGRIHVYSESVQGCGWTSRQCFTYEQQEDFVGGVINDGAKTKKRDVAVIIEEECKHWISFDLKYCLNQISSRKRLSRKCHKSESHACKIQQIIRKGIIRKQANQNLQPRLRRAF